MWGGVMWAGAPWAGIMFVGGAAPCFGDAEGLDSAALAYGSDFTLAEALGGDSTAVMTASSESAAYGYGTTASRASVTGGDRKRRGC
jgi:hypothetical protein